MKKRPTEWEQLISDYHRDNKKILRQKYKWLTPKPESRVNEKDGKQITSEESDGTTGEAS